MGFSLKKAVKAVGKVAAAPAVAVTRASGLKSLSSKVEKAVGYTEKEKNQLDSAGKGIQIGAASLAVIGAAPLIASGASTVAAGVKGGFSAIGAASGKLGVALKSGAAGNLLSKGVGLAKNLFSKSNVADAANQSTDGSSADAAAGLQGAAGDLISRIPAGLRGEAQRLLGRAVGADGDTSINVSGGPNPLQMGMGTDIGAMFIPALVIGALFLLTGKKK